MSVSLDFKGRSLVQPRLSCHLAHKCVPLDMDGYGLIHAQCTFATKIYYCLWQVMHDSDDDFVLKTGIRLPEEHEGTPAGDYEAKREWIKENIIDIDGDYADLGEDEDIMNYLKTIGPDMSICTFSVNYRQNGVLNTDPLEANKLNKFLFERFSKTAVGQPNPEIIFTSTTVTQNESNAAFFIQAQTRLGLIPDPAKPFYYLVSTLMSPWPTADDWPHHIEGLVRDAINDYMGDNDITNP
eukprot:TRINITY_DN889_c1_g1_i1.p1 TRINITY_DN889_c1_g1~~TRINITY_DN889_c1_g1_i1.p1  ORF type:complete len:240 (+),score=24.13 TRINITY_DN889_c1_g1_i1:760-1479(+)